eukprot:scaffold119714_cov32-Tisochrysis_lutea.AAC.1
MSLDACSCVLCPYHDTASFCLAWKTRAKELATRTPKWHSSLMAGQRASAKERQRGAARGSAASAARPKRCAVSWPTRGDLSTKVQLE